MLHQNPKKPTNIVCVGCLMFSLIINNQFCQKKTHTDTHTHKREPLTRLKNLCWLLGFVYSVNQRNTQIFFLPFLFFFYLFFWFFNLVLSISSLLKHGLITICIFIGGWYKKAVEIFCYLLSSRIRWASTSKDWIFQKILSWNGKQFKKR